MIEYEFTRTCVRRNKMNKTVPMTRVRRRVNDVLKNLAPYIPPEPEEGEPIERPYKMKTSIKAKRARAQIEQLRKRLPAVVRFKVLGDEVDLL